MQKSIDSAIAGFGDFTKTGEASLSDYIAKYMAGNKDAGARTSQEIGAVDRYYNGDVDNALSTLRKNRQTSILAAADRASKASMAALHGSMLTNDGGRSSYDSRLALKNYGDIATNAAVDDSNQARNDYGWLLGQQSSMMGRRQQMADTLAGRALVPQAARSALMGQNLGFLGQMGQLDQGNKFYGLQANSRGGVADFFDNADQGISNVLAMIGSAYSGGQKVNTAGSPTTNPNIGGGGGGFAGLYPSSGGTYGAGGYSPNAMYAPDTGMAAYSNGGYYDYQDTSPNFNYSAPANYTSPYTGQGANGDFGGGFGGLGSNAGIYA